MEESQFDVITFGTGLVESIIAAALSKAGYKVAHIDSNSYYGGDEASLSLEELVQWTDKLPGSASCFQRASRSTEVPNQSRQYSICLRPAIFPSVGPLINSLVSSGVSKYSGFRLLDCVSVYDRSGRIKSVPGSKEDIFKSKVISLIEKRRLMRFLTFAAGDLEGKKELEGKHNVPFVEFLKTVFMLSEDVSSVIAYSLAFCMSSTEPTLHALRRLQKYLRSSGRYGSSPFLIGHYGGIGDIAQGFCRAAAVSGGVYILGRQISSISSLPTQKLGDDDGEIKNGTLKFNYAVELKDFPDTLSCNLIISSPSYVPHSLKEVVFQLPASSQDAFKSNVASIARCIAIIDQALPLRSQDIESESQTIASEETEDESRSVPQASSRDPGVDTGILVFPPSSVIGGSSTHSATVLVNGEGSMSTPKGKWLVYIALPLSEEPEPSISPETLLKPYLDALLSLSVGTCIQPLFTTFYLEVSTSSPPTATENTSSLDEKTYLIPTPLPFTALPDLPDDATNHAESLFVQAVKVLQKYTKREEDESDEIVFWPPLPIDNDDDDEW